MNFITVPVKEWEGNYIPTGANYCNYASDCPFASLPKVDCYNSDCTFMRVVVVGESITGVRELFDDVREHNTKKIEA